MKGVFFIHEQKFYIKVPRWLVHDVADRKLIMTYLYLYRLQSLEHKLTASLYYLITDCGYAFFSDLRSTNLQFRKSLQYFIDNDMVDIDKNIMEVPANEAFGVILQEKFYLHDQYILLTCKELDTILSYEGKAKKENLIHCFLYIKSHINLGRGKPHAFWGSLKVMSETIGLSYNACVASIRELLSLELLVTYDDLTLSSKRYRASTVYVLHAFDARQKYEEAIGYIKRYQAIKASTEK